MREITFANGYYYHIYNRGVDKRIIFQDKGDYFRFLYYLRSLRGSASSKEAEPLISLIAYTLLPNHFHLLIKQLKENGIVKFMHDFSTSYTMFFNAKYKRSGVLFQGKYKAVEVESDEQLLYLSAYINGNAEIHRLAKAESWPWSSCLDYLGKRNGTLCKEEEVLNGFGSLVDYRNYLDEVIENSKLTKEELKNIRME